MMMNHEAAAVMQMQKILKQRQIENKRYEVELRLIEEAQRRARLNYERNRQEFLNLIRARREKWWRADENVRRDMAAKKEFRDLIAKLELANDRDEAAKVVKPTPRNDERNRQAVRRVDFDDDLTTNSSSSSPTPLSSSPNSFNSNDDQDAEDVEISTSRLLTKRSQSSVALVGQATATAPKKSTQRPKTSKPVLSSSIPRSILSSSYNQMAQLQQRHRAYEDQATKEIRMAFLIDRFIKRTPCSIEKSFGPAGARERLAQEMQTKIKNEISREREKAVKKDLRYYELVDCLSENKF